MLTHGGAVAAVGGLLQEKPLEGLGELQLRLIQRFFQHVRGFRFA